MTQVTVEYIGPSRPGVLVRDADGDLVSVGYGETAEVDERVAAGLALQTDNWRVVGGDPPKDDDPGDGLDALTVPVLTEQAQALGIETKDMKKADLIAAIRGASPASGDGQQPEGDQSSE